MGCGSSNIIPTQIYNNVLPIYEIDLDLPIIDRWREVCKDYQIKMKNLINEIKQNQSFRYPKELLQWIEKDGQNYNYLDFKENLQAISQLLEIPYSDLFLINIMYELDSQDAVKIEKFSSSAQKVPSECTAIVCRNHEKKVFICRNWDYFYGQKQLQDLQIQADFYKNKKKICSQIMPACTIIPHSGIKDGKFAICFNLRTDGSREENLANLLIKKNYAQAKFLLFDAMLTEENYDGVVKRLTETKTAAPVFYTVVGTKENEGTIIEKARERVYYQQKLSSSNWFCSIANTDSDKSNKINDTRGRTAVENMNYLAQKFQSFNEQRVLQQVLYQPPNFQDKDTILTIIMNPSSENLQININGKIQNQNQ